MAFHLTTKAKEDLKNIARYTQENWGKKQRNIYLKQIDDIFHLLSQGKQKGKIYDHIKKGYFKYNVGKHIIFYRQFTKSEIQIVRILHQRMDAPNHI